LTPNIAGLAEALDSRAAKDFTRGTHRTGPPDATLARVAPLARQMGITRLGNVTGLDRIGIPVTIAVRPNSRSLAVSQGKGLTLAQALASALMEATEIFHGEDIAARCRHAAYTEISSDACATAPGTLAGTGLALPDQDRIAWIEGLDLLSRESCWVPWEIVHTDYTLPTAHSGEHFLSGTNGLGSGNHVLEALSAGICELVERDAVALWNARGIRERARSRLELNSVDDEDCRALIEAYGRAGIAPRVWDVTSDIGIPAFICDIPAAAEETFDALRRFRGAGCHPDRCVALARALTEAAQVRLTYIAGNRDDLPPSEYHETPREKLGAALLDATSQAAPPRAFGEVANFTADDLALDVRWELERLGAAGIEKVVAVDLTRPDFGIPVVRMVIPGLEWDCSHPDYVSGARALAAGRGPE
jgi:YcaO-like protein with predicted kinase domain